MIVAEITTDCLADHYDRESIGSSPTSMDYVGKQFDSEALRNWWGWADDYNDNYFELALDVEGKTNFKLYDDDGELYYEGWLIDDQEAMVQQFVLDWAKADSGCTTIKVFRPGGYEQEIG